jgi:hypothetical protein
MTRPKKTPKVNHSLVALDLKLTTLVALDLKHVDHKWRLTRPQVELQEMVCWSQLGNSLLLLLLLLF